MEHFSLASVTYHLGLYSTQTMGQSKGTVPRVTTQDVQCAKMFQYYIRVIVTRSYFCLPNFSTGFSPVFHIISVFIQLRFYSVVEIHRI